jgi:hypothetical protein
MVTAARCCLYFVREDVFCAFKGFYCLDLRLDLKDLYFILCQISILYVISLNPGKRKKRPDAG